MNGPSESYKELKRRQLKTVAAKPLPMEKEVSFPPLQTTNDRADGTSVPSKYQIPSIERQMELELLLKHLDELIERNNVSLGNMFIAPRSLPARLCPRQYAERRKNEETDLSRFELM